MKTLYAVLWAGWLVAFLGIEFTAIGTGNSRYTLSDFVWRLEQINSAWTFLRFFIAAFFLWLTLHMALGWFR